MSSDPGLNQIAGVVDLEAHELQGATIEIIENQTIKDHLIEEPKNPKIQEHIRLHFDTIGTPLNLVERPYDLLESILHAVIAHFNHLRVAGAIHGDVSLGNILCARKSFGAILEEAELGFEMPTEMMAKSILIDGNLSARLNSHSLPRAGKRLSGTLPYPSEYLLTCWINGDDALHTPIDDLESFVWVLIVVMGQWQMKTTKMKTTLINYFQGLQSDDPSLINTHKSALISHLSKSNYHPLYNLAIRWLDMLDDAGKADRKDFKTPTTADRYIGIYRKFLEEGSHWLRTHQAELQKPVYEFSNLARSTT